eukprot:TRINITY_DN6264_c0_g1_i1.p2 TRINITY_DN6264_c0_g1~~TRINITY_DN6264_c0_g1_i1.p2  ORF type:complete len:179 (-),score=58.90 TRINITY_DN6264_c0_g1_i1:38-574(-)
MAEATAAAGGGKPGAGSKPVFVYEYLNFAWGHQHEVKALDDAGMLYAFSQAKDEAACPNSLVKEPMEWWDFMKQKMTAENEGKPVATAEEMAKVRAEVAKLGANAPAMGPEIDTARDAGNKTVYVAVPKKGSFWSKAPPGSFQLVLLRQRGDTSRTSTNAQARQLADTAEGMLGVVMS